jgi:CheY-like chemotaxis protein
MVAEGLLNNIGLAPDVVDNGEQAIQAFLDGCYDLILMDVQMPKLDGLSAARRIRELEQPMRADPSYRPVRMIAMTAHAMQGHREACLDAGMDDYIAKPIDPQALATMVRKWLDEAGPTKTNQKAH